MNPVTLFRDTLMTIKLPQSTFVSTSSTFYMCIKRISFRFDECLKGSGYEKISLKQEYEQNLIKQSVQN